jgi:hypothetical protein
MTPDELRLLLITAKLFRARLDDMGPAYVEMDKQTMDEALEPFEVARPGPQPMDEQREVLDRQSS